MVKLALIGTSCVGKTTILNAIKANYKSNSSVICIEEAARSYFEANPLVTDRFGLTAQAKIQEHAYLTEKAAMLQKPDAIICDRSVIDAAAYVWAVGSHADGVKLLKKCSDWLQTYTCFYLLSPQNIEFKVDKVRQESLEERERFHKAFIELLSFNHISFTMLSGTLGSRIKTVSEAIKKSLRTKN